MSSTPLLTTSTVTPRLYYRQVPVPVSEQDLSTIRGMRVASGAYVNQIDSWVAEMQLRTRIVWLVYLSDPNQPSASVPAAIAMVSMLLHNQADPTLASLHPNARVEITSLFVYGAYRNRGISRQIITDTERRALQLGASYTTFNTPVTSTQTLDILKQLGYKEYKQREQRYTLTETQHCGVSGDSPLAAFFEKQLLSRTPF